MRIFKSLTVAVCLLVSFTLKAQDIIIKVNKEEIKAKVLEVEESVIKYKKFDFLDGPTYSVNKNEVFMIIYKSGKRETFETSVAAVSQPVQAQQPRTQTQTNADPVKAAFDQAFNPEPDANAEHLAFHKGTSFLQLGTGVGGDITKATGAISSIPLLQVRYEFSMTDKISVGGLLSYRSAKYDFDLTSSNILLGARGNYHFATTDKFDPYVGAMIGYNIVKNSYGDDEDDFYEEGSSSASKSFFGGQIGANYYFSESLGAWADLGYGLAYFNAGIVFKF